MTVSLGEHIHHICVQFRMLRGTARRHRWVVFLVGVEVLYEPDELPAQAAAPLSPLTDAQPNWGWGALHFGRAGAGGMAAKVGGRKKCDHQPPELGDAPRLYRTRTAAG
jgi:hypothetical protein